MEGPDFGEGGERQETEIVWGNFRCGILSRRNLSSRTSEDFILMECVETCASSNCKEKG